MFFSSPSADLNIMIFLLLVAFIASVIAYFFSKRFLVGIFTMSALGNLTFYLNSGSEIFDIYKIKGVVVFTLDIWPYINLALLVLIIFNFLRQRNEKAKKE